MLISVLLRREVTSAVVKEALLQSKIASLSMQEYHRNFNDENLLHVMSMNLMILVYYYTGVCIYESRWSHAFI